MPKFSKNENSLFKTKNNNVMYVRNIQLIEKGENQTSLSKGDLVVCLLMVEDLVECLTMEEGLASHLVLVEGPVVWLGV